MTSSQFVAQEVTAQVVVAPTVSSLLCVGCKCSEPCGLARVASQIAYGEDVAHSLLGDILDFSGGLDVIRELKSQIARAMQGVSIDAAERLLKTLCILPQPSSFTLATATQGYAIIFVVGENYTTHAVQVVPA